MRRLIVATLMLPLLTVGFVGCAEKTTVESERKISTPTGTTTIKTEQEVKKTGENPP